MKRKDINKLKSLGFINDDDILSIYGQEILDKFTNILINTLKNEGFKHYNVNFIKAKVKGKYYRIINDTFEIMISDDNILNASLDLNYMFSKFIKDVLGISLIEGYKINRNYKYYYGYMRNLEAFYIVKQNKNQAYLRFDLFKIFLSCIKEDSYLSCYLISHLVLIPLHKTKSGVLSYAKNVGEKSNITILIDERDISNLEKKKDVFNKRIPFIIYVGPKELKRQTITIEYQNEKIEILLNDIDTINNLLLKSFKDKYNNNLKEIFLLDKEKLEIGFSNNIVKVNLCESCQINNYKYFLTPFNRVSKNYKCLICKKEANNLIYLKRKSGIE